LPGAIKISPSPTRGDCASFHASACSRPPEPIIKTANFVIILPAFAIIATMNTQPITHETILATIQTWPMGRRLQLIQEIIQDIQSESESVPAPKHTADQALGLLRSYSDALPPTDDEVNQWLEEERAKKNS